MIKKIIIVLTCILFLMPLISQPSWFWQNPIPTSNSLNTVFCVSNSIMYSAGQSGSIIKTTNGGVNWTMLQTGTSSAFSSIFFVNDNTGWTVGSLGNHTTILKTINGGLNWSSQSNDTACILQDVYFIDSQTGWTVGGYYSNGSTILKTTNGGNNWIQKPSGTNAWFYRVKFTSAQTGWAEADNILIKTTNGGDSWFNATPSGSSVLRSLEFIDNNTGWVASNSPNSILKTTNGGVSWTSQLSSGTPFNIKFTDQNSGFAILNPGSVLRTTNGGTNWTPQATGFYEFLVSMSFANSSVGVATGSYGELLKTSNNGMNWQSLRTTQINGTINDVRFVNPLTGWAAAGENDLGNIYKTTNGGDNWISQLYYPTMFQSLSFIDENTGWCVGYSNGNETGRVFSTTNGGSTWNFVVNISYVLGVQKVIFKSPQEGFILYGEFPSAYGRIIRTTNSGTNWSVVGGATSFLYDMQFLSNNVGLAAGENGTVLRTNNGGLNWYYGYSGVTSIMRGLTAVNPNTAFMSGQEQLLKSTDAGITWEQSPAMEGYDLYTVCFVNNQVGWTGGYGGEVLYTTNGGSNWLQYSSFTTNGIAKFFFISELTGWVSGYSGTLLKTTDGGNIVDVHSQNIQIPGIFALKQNYPNPFNPTTNIKFDLPRSGFVKLTVYDALGREVAILVDQEMKAGSYNADWDASSYSSGIYFYKLVVGDNTNNGSFVETKKMVLIK